MKIPYRVQPRPVGSGELRLGQSLEMGESVNDFAFCLMVTEDEIHKRYCFIEGRMKSEKDGPETNPSYNQVNPTAINDEDSESELAENLILSA